MIKAVIFDYDGVVKKSQKLSLDITDLYKISVEEYEKFIPQLKPIIEKFDKGLIGQEKLWMLSLYYWERSYRSWKFLHSKCFS